MSVDWLLRRDWDRVYPFVDALEFRTSKQISELAHMGKCATQYALVLAHRYQLVEAKSHNGRMLWRLSRTQAPAPRNNSDHIAPSAEPITAPASTSVK